MWSPTKLMRIFEVLWLVAAGISLGMAIYYIASGRGTAAEYVYLFVIAGLCVLMSFIKRKSRLFILKREQERRLARPQ